MVTDDVFDADDSGSSVPHHVPPVLCDEYEGLVEDLSDMIAVFRVVPAREMV